MNEEVKLDEFYCKDCKITVTEEPGYLNSKCPTCYKIINKVGSLLPTIKWNCSQGGVKRK